MLEQSKFYAGNISGAIKNKDAKGALEGLKGMGNMFANKIKK